MVVEIMLQYLYGHACALPLRNHYAHILRQSEFSLNDGNKLRSESSTLLLGRAFMYSIGEKYGIDGLKNVASESFAALLEQREWHTGWNSSGISIGSLGLAIKHVYSSTPESDRGLRDQVVGYVKTHLEPLLSLEEFKMVLAEVPQLSYQLLVQDVGNKPGEEIVSWDLPTRKRKRSP